MCAKWSISMAWPGPESPSGPHMVNMCGCMDARPTRSRAAPHSKTSH